MCLAAELRDVLLGLLDALAPRELEQLANDLRHALRRADDDPRRLLRLVRRGLAAADHRRARLHDIEGRAELVREPGRELAHGREPVCVPELLERRGEAVAHRVHLAREIRQLVALRELHGTDEVAATDAPSLGRQRRGGTTHEPLPQREREARR